MCFSCGFFLLLNLLKATFKNSFQVEATQALSNLKELYAIFTFFRFQEKPPLLPAERATSRHAQGRADVSVLSCAAYRRQQQPIVVFNTDADLLDYDSEAIINNAAEIPKDKSTFFLYVLLKVQCALHWRPLDLLRVALFR